MSHKSAMHILIIGDAFPPMRTSGALMLKDLAEEFGAQGNKVTVVLPLGHQNQRIVTESSGRVQLIRINAFEAKDKKYLYRALAEFINPFLIWRELKKYRPFVDHSVDLVVWYSPSIFWGPMIAGVRARWHCKSYLILRDLFPDWAIDLGLLHKLSPVTLFLKMVAYYQYKQADFIGLQSPNNIHYFVKKYPLMKNRVKLLWNWIGRSNNVSQRCSIQISKTKLLDKKIFVYAGNIGVAQGIHIFLNIILAFKNREDIGFIFIGRGAELESLKEMVIRLKLENVLFFSEIPSDEIPGLYAQCDFGMIALDIRHKTHNIPGKFSSYMDSGLPVFGVVNPGNDLIDIVKKNNLGMLIDNSEFSAIKKCAEQFINSIDIYLAQKNQCQKISLQFFQAGRAAEEILNCFCWR
jgi:glycosyltransferase involved in cell wall biosynthesis